MRNPCVARGLLWCLIAAGVSTSSIVLGASAQVPRTDADSDAKTLSKALRYGAWACARLGYYSGRVQYPPTLVCRQFDPGADTSRMVIADSAGKVLVNLIGWEVRSDSILDAASRSIREDLVGQYGLGRDCGGENASTSSFAGWAGRETIL